MKEGLIKLTHPQYGPVWIQAEKVLYVHHYVGQSDTVSSLITFIGGKTLEVHESEMWIKDKLQTDEERKLN